MGKRSAAGELFLGDMGSMQRELRPSIQREDQPTMETKLEQIAVKAVNQLPKSAWCGRSARHVLWEPGAGNCLRRPGGREVTRVPTAKVDGQRSIAEDDARGPIPDITPAYWQPVAVRAVPCLSGNRNGPSLCNEAQAPTGEIAETPPSIRK